MTLEDRTVTVVMPVYNEAKFIQDSLETVCHQDYPNGLMEVFVVDGGSTDETIKYALEMQRRYPQIKLLHNPRRSAAAALNLAISETKSDYVVRVDGHTRIAFDYVRQCVNELQRTQADVVGGKMVTRGTSPFEQAVALATSSCFGVGASRFHYSRIDQWADTVYLGAWRREFFLHYGLFDEHVGCNEDDEMNSRIRKQGGRIYLSQKICSEYTPRDNFQRLWKQYFRYGFWKVPVMRKHPQQMRWTHFVPLATVLSAFVLATGSTLCSEARMGLFALVCFYVAANVFVSVSLIFKEKQQTLFCLPLIFGVLHASYGLGFLFGGVIFFFKGVKEKMERIVG